MAVTQQIILEHTFPHEEIVIHDNTTNAVTYNTAADTYYPYLSVFMSSRGIDRKLVEITTLKSYYQQFGTTNFKKYGQPHLMPEAFLSNNNTRVWCMRVTLDDARYAHNVLSLWYKADVEKKRFNIKFTTKSYDLGFSEGMDIDPSLKDTYEIDQLGNLENLIELGETLDGVALEDGTYVDEEGYTQVPLAVFVSAGRGLYGNDYRWRISTDTSYDAEYGIKLYKFEIIDASNSTLVLSKIGGIISSPRMTKTMFINDLVEDIDIEKLPAYINVYENNVERIYDAYHAFCQELVEADPTLDVVIPAVDAFDPLFGFNVKPYGAKVMTKIPYITHVSPLTDDIDQTDENFDASLYTSTPIITLDAVGGNTFGGGNDGAAMDEKDPDKRQAAINECYIKAFEGVYDRYILSSSRIQSMALYDANFDMPVKMAFAKLALYRRTAICYLDTNYHTILGEDSARKVENEFAALDEMVEDFTNFSGCWLADVNTHFYTIKESSTGKRIPVTITYLLAANDAAHREAYGITTPRVGSICQLEGHVKNSLSPDLQDTDAELKQLLFDARINYFEATDEDDTFERATQSTFMRTKKSDLMEETNVLCLLSWIDILRKELRNNRYKTTTARKREEFREYLLEKYSDLVGTYFDSMDIVYTANEYEQANNITHLKTSVSFPHIGYIGLIEVEVNKAQYDPDDTEEEDN